MKEPIRQSVVDHDLTPRFAVSTAVAASPSAATETTIATVTIPRFGDLQVVSGIEVVAWAAYTVGTSGVSVQLQLKQTDKSGSAIADSGATTATATDLGALAINGFDAGAGVATYVLTMTVASASAASTVSAVYLRALVV